jgi:hypothetical protein
MSASELEAHIFSASTTERPHCRIGSSERDNPAFVMLLQASQHEGPPLALKLSHLA